MNKTKATSLTREQVRQYLPAALDKAFQSYNSYTQREVTEEKFSTHHTACKVAIAHIQLLIKLGEWAEMDVEESIEKLFDMSNSREEYDDYLKRKAAKDADYLA
jgi:hypothetical protein